jgi:hypothetical protein
VYSWEYVALIRQVLALGKPVVMILVNGGAVAIDGFIQGPAAIVEVFCYAIFFLSFFKF